MAEELLSGDRVIAPMTKEQIFNKVCEILKNESLVEPDAEIRMATLMTDSLGMDSLDLLDLSMEVEREFGVKIPDEDFYKMNTYTVGVLCGIIENEMQKKTGL